MGAEVDLKANAPTFWAARGRIYIKYLQTQRPINGTYYVNLLDGFKKKKHLILTKKKLFFYLENLRVLMCVVAQAKLLNWVTNCSHIRHIIRI